MGRLCGENELVRKIERAFPASGKSALGLGIGDDAALYQPRAGREIVLTCDWFLEGSHFLREKHPAGSVGWKCLARAVSDIAAMGSEPRCFLLSLALPPNATGKWLNGFLGGLRRASKTLHCELAGGDTTRRDEILINVTVIGEVRKGQAVRRAGAKEGDLIYVSGCLGEAELGLLLLRRSGVARVEQNRALRKHLYPEPRLALGKWLAEKHMATSMIDISDGLSTDLGRMCASSDVGALIQAERLPVSMQASSNDRLTLSLHGGDDYELLFTVKPESARKIPGEFKGVSITKIGKIMTGKTILLQRGDHTSRLKAQGWDPFR